MYRYKECGFKLVSLCNDPPVGSIEVWIDAAPDRKDDYGRLLHLVWSKFPERWFRLPACAGHLKELVRRGEEYILDQELWHPSQDHPNILTR